MAEGCQMKFEYLKGEKCGSYACCKLKPNWCDQQVVPGNMQWSSPTNSYFINIPI